MDSQIYQSPQTQEIIQYIRDTYGDHPEFLWQKSPANSIFRNQQNRKWYAAILVIPASKLGLNSDEKIEVIDLRFDKGEALDFSQANDNIYPGYHMNKNNWITIILNHQTPTPQILSLIDHSYEISLKKPK